MIKFELSRALLLPFFFFTGPSTTAIHTLSLHDALPIFGALSDWFLNGPQFPRSPTSIRSKSDSSGEDRKSTRLNSSHVAISYAVFCLKKKKQQYCLITATTHLPRLLRRCPTDYTPMCSL